MVNVPELLLDQSASRNDAKIISKYHTAILGLLKTEGNTQILFFNLLEVLVKLNIINLQPIKILNAFLMDN
jgi:hypothetical protein